MLGPAGIDTNRGKDAPHYARNIFNDVGSIVTIYLRFIGAKLIIYLFI